MKARPFSIILTSSLLFLAGPIYLSYWAIHMSGDLQLAWSSSNPVWVTLLATGVIVGVGVWQVRPWGYWSFLGYSVLTLGYEGYQYVMVNQDSLYFMTLTMAFGIFAGSYLLQKHVSSPYFNPRMRWWERDPRFKVDMIAKFQVNSQKQNGSLLDISKGGCFAQLETILFPGDIIDLRLGVDNYDLRTRAKVIWRSTRPNGYGLMFYNMTRTQKKDVESLVNFIVQKHDPHIPPMEKHGAA